MFVTFVETLPVAQRVADEEDRVSLLSSLLGAMQKVRGDA